MMASAKATKNIIREKVIIGEKNPKDIRFGGVRYALICINDIRLKTSANLQKSIIISKR
jgi:hypothetical protein